jgi:hypothetical protein
MLVVAVALAKVKNAAARANAAMVVSHGRMPGAGGALLEGGAMTGGGTDARADLRGRIVIFDRDVLPLDEAGFPKSVAERGHEDGRVSE